LREKGLQKNVRGFDKGKKKKKKKGEFQQAEGGSMFVSGEYVYGKRKRKKKDLGGDSG